MTTQDTARFPSPTSNGLPSVDCDRVAADVCVPRGAASGMGIPLAASDTWTGGELPFNPQPKPERAARAQTKETLRRKRQLSNARRTANKVRNEHGGKDWGVKNDLARRRDGNRCVFRCPTQRLGVQVHHWQRSVGAGGKNEIPNLVTLCAGCHDGAHLGRITREQIRERLIALHGPHAVVLSRDEQEDAEDFPAGYCPVLSPMDGRA